MSEGVDAGVPLMLPAKVAGGEMLKSQPGPTGQVEVGGGEQKPKHSEPLQSSVTTDQLKQRKGTANEVLGVGRDASPEEIKNAYFDALKALRPDINMDPETVELAKKINGAYEAAGDPVKRAKYDLEAAKGEAARAAAGFTPSEKLNPVEVTEALKWADGVVGSMDPSQIEEIKNRSMEAAAQAREKGLTKPEQINYIMGNSITTNFLKLVPNENTQFILQSAAEKNAGNPEVMIMLLLLIMALLMEAAADLVSDNTDGFLEKVAGALATGGMGAVYEFTRVKKEEKKTEDKATEVKVEKVKVEEDMVEVTAVRPQEVALPVGQQPEQLKAASVPQLPAVAETQVVQNGQVNIGSTIFTAAVMSKMNQTVSVASQS